VLPSLVTARLAVHETMRTQGRSRPVLAKRLGTTEIALWHLRKLRHHSDIPAIDRAPAVMNAELAIALPDLGPEKQAA